MNTMNQFNQFFHQIFIGDLHDFISITTKEKIGSREIGINPSLQHYFFCVGGFLIF